jgi:hypothetical protein
MAETGKHFKAEQIVNLLHEIDAMAANGKSLLEACKKSGISDDHYYSWRKMYGGLNVDMARKFDELEAENVRLKQRLAELSLGEIKNKLLPETPVPSNKNASFDLSALSNNIEKQLEEVRQGVTLETRNSALSEFEAQLITAPVVDQAASLFQHPHEDKSESRLFAKLAHQAQVKAVEKQSVPHARIQPAEHYSKSRRLHETLGKIAQYLDPLAQHVKKAEPHIKRSYIFDPQTVFTNLTCRTAHSDSRKQYLSESALLDHVLLSVILCAPAPVDISQPLDMFEALKEQLNKLKLRSLDDLDLLGKQLQEYKLRLQTIDDMDLLGQVQQVNKLKLQTFDGLDLLGKVLQDDLIHLRLAPDFPMHVQFKGNYGEDCIDVHTLNIEAFGLVTYKLKVEDVSPELMDGIGLFLLDHIDRFPEALLRVEA